MRKITLLFLTVLQIFLLQGCSTAKTISPEQIVFGFSAKAEFQAGDITSFCSVEYPGAGLLRCTVLSPENIAGLQYHWEGQNFELLYSGLSAQSEICTLPPDNFALILKDVLDYASRVNVLTPEKGASFSGTLEQKAFSIRVNSHNGFIEEISIPEKHFSVKFSEVKQIP